MAISARRMQYSVADHVRVEEHSNVKHQYFAGEMFAVAGGTPEHARLAAAVITILGVQLARLPRRCAVFTSDARVRVAATGLTTCPDVSVVCGKVQRDADDALAMVNPVRLVEVLSPATQAYDLTTKLEHYQLVPTLNAVVFVFQERPHVEVVERAADAWSTRSADAGDRIRAECLDCELDVDALYASPG
ncbi:MAG: Uma2 family endonuclease [Deltaproteobacteria bacterium]|nr:Uma2 family endonuclease [Deltaproteobacteria bacterium]